MSWKFRRSEAANWPTTGVGAFGLSSSNGIAHNGPIAAASASNKNNYAFKIEGNDKPSSGADPQPSKRYFVGLVMGAPEQGGNANTAQLLQSTIEVNSNIVKVNATAS